MPGTVLKVFFFHRAAVSLVFRERDAHSLRNTSSVNIGIHPTCSVLVQTVLGNVRVPCLLQLFCGGKTCGANRVGANQARRAEARGLRRFFLFFPVKEIGARSRFVKWDLGGHLPVAPSGQIPLASVRLS